MSNSFEIKLKRLGKKKIYTETISATTPIYTLRDLISRCVSSKVQTYNAKRDNATLLAFLTPSQIQEQSETGKIGFGAVHNFKTADEATSIAVALQAYEDGMFLVFIDDQEITTLDTAIQLKKDQNITFLRMTFLTGLSW